MNKSKKILEFKTITDSFSGSICLAKWYHLNLYLHLGENHSCYHPDPHKISLEELALDESALHNSNFKKQQRKLMLQGLRPKECQYCWNIEDLKTEQHLSDRMIKSFEQNQSRPELFKQLQSFTGDESVVPTVIEVSFSNLCNFKCVYCHPKSSSKWQREIEQYGKFEGLNDNYAITQTIYSSEDTPYVKAWKVWWEKISSKVDALRLTGGEPLLHKTTFELLENLKKAKPSKLYLMVNSNMGISEKILTHFVSEISLILEKKSIAGFKLYTSLESVGRQAEYARYGLDFDLWKRNVEYFLEKAPDAQLSIMCTYNLLCVTEFTKFLETLLELRKKYCQKKRRIEVDISYITGPQHLLIELLPSSFVKHISASLQFMEEHCDENKPWMFDAVEISKMKRIRDHFLTNRLQPIQEKHFLEIANSFFQQIDERRDLNFSETFPELYQLLCQYKKS